MTLKSPRFLVLAHEICFDINDKMLPCLCGADLPSGCAIPRVSHKEILASTVEHTAALHERFAKPVLPRQDKVAVDFETVAHRLERNSDVAADVELQAAGSSPSKETAVTGGIRDLNNVHEITDLRQLIQENLFLCPKTEARRLSHSPERERRRVQILTQKFEFQARRQRRQEDEQREGLVQEVWKSHESATLGKIVSREFVIFCASCVDVFILFFDPWCTTCTSMTMRGRQHRRQDERETVGAG